MGDLRIKYSGFTLFELLFVSCVIFILLGTFAIYANAAIKVAKEVAMQNELLAIRMAIQHYVIINGYPPKELVSLLKKTLTCQSPDGKVIFEAYLKADRIDKKGNLVDPFMNKYEYHEGRIWSGTEGHQSW